MRSLFVLVGLALAGLGASCVALDDLASSEPGPAFEAGAGEAAAAGEGLTLRAVPESLDVNPGGTYTIAIEVVRTGGFAGAVTIDAAGLPSGATMSPVLLTATATRADVSLTLAATTAFGAVPITLQAASADGHLRASTQLALRVSARPGTLDTTFGDQGAVVTALGGGEDYGRGLAIQSDGKIVVVGFTQNGALPEGYDLAVLRYDASGKLDTTFDGDGKVVIAVTAKEDYANAVAIQPDGKIVIAGHCRFATELDITLLRLLPDGALDSSFGTGGIARLTRASTNEYALAMSLQSDGKIVVFGEGETDGTFNQDYLVARFNANGTPDTTFGTAGRTLTPIGTGEDWGVTGAIQSDGKLLVSGSRDGSDGFATVRYAPDGGLDTSFGTGGKAITTVGQDSEGEAIAIQQDGKMVVAGGSRVSQNVSFQTTLVRYLANGTLDSAFGKNGVVIDARSSTSYAWATSLQKDGKILVAGEVYDVSAAADDFALWRFLPDGQPDTAFGTDGRVISALARGNDVANAMALQSDGKIVVVGRAFGSTTDIALARYWP